VAVTISAYALVTEAEASEYLGITPAVNSDVMRRLINAVTALIEKTLRREFKQRTYTETYDGSGGGSLFLKHFPIISVTSVERLDEDGTTADTLTTSDYWSVDAIGEIRAKTAVAFWKADQNYKVVYSAGFATIPDDVAQVALQLIARAYRDRDKKREDVQSVTLDRETTRYTKADRIKTIREELGHYYIPAMVRQ